MADLIPMLMAAAGATPPGPSSRGEAIFTDTSGAISWVVPTGVTKVSAVCIGAGGGGQGDSNGGSGGGGGDLRYYNNLSVTPGETLTITVGAAGVRATSAGGFTRIARSGTTLLEAAGGGLGSTSGSGAKNGTSTTVGGSIGGGDGGTASDPLSTQSSGGGGAGGYSGNGGNGGVGTANGNAGAGGAGGGGAGSGSTARGGAGGGVNVFGEDFNGQGGLTNSPTSNNGGGAAGGSYGDGNVGTFWRSASGNARPTGFGGGGMGSDISGTAGDSVDANGGQGAVRIVYPGDSRSFPSTDVWMSNVITTVIETQSSSNTITIPASAASGDLAFLLNMHQSTGAQSDPTGWTRIAGQNASSPTMTFWYRILQSGDPGATVTMTSGTNQSAEMFVFRKATGTFSSVTAVGGTCVRNSATTLTQTQNASTATAPFIVFGVYSTPNLTMMSPDMFFNGGIAGSGKLEPGAMYGNENGDTSRQAFIRFRIYDDAPSVNVDVKNRTTDTIFGLGSCILEVS